MRRRQPVRSGIWYMGGKRKRRQREEICLFGALAALILGTLGSLVVKKTIWWQKKTVYDYV